MDCKRALEGANGNLEQAIEALRQKGIATAVKKSSRDANEGVVETYIHSGGRIGAMIELNCETDFVARLPEFRELAHNLAMQIAAMSPMCISRDEMSEDNDGAKHEGLILLEQPFIKDDSNTINDLIVDVIATVGENIRVRRFARFALGASEVQVCNPATVEHS
jgi:elongation factor Ts